MLGNLPLAERMRPQNFEEYIGQKHLVGEGAILRRLIENEQIPSIILWGPPGVGKTTLAKMISLLIKRPFSMLSAVNSGVKDVRETIEKAQKSRFINQRPPILFIDEIHRFSKSQQDSLLGAVEQGIITLIGATTENPSFEVITPLLSRCQVYILNYLNDDELKQLVHNAITKDFYLKQISWNIEEWDAMLQFSGGDARKMYNTIELLASASQEAQLHITNKFVTEVLQHKIADYDKNGEMHYDIISAFIKSVRGSDPNAAVYWLARMIAGGEDLKFIARRLLILAAEDIGLANPNALLLAQATMQAVHTIGYPESRIVLSQTTIYLATSPKSNSAYLSIDEALSLVERTGNLPVPLHLRNAPTKLMKQIGYGADYKYAHDYKDNFIEQEFLPQDLIGNILYHPQDNAQEIKIKERLQKIWANIYKY